MSIEDILYAPINTKPELVVPKSWLDVMRHLRSYWPSQVSLAGGALRDLDLGRPIKDVDIFLPYNEDMHALLYDCLEPFALNVIDEVMHEDASGGGSRIPANHYQFVHDGYLFEITQRFDACVNERDVLDTFDLGLCMICLDGENVYRAPEYEKDARDHTITMIRDTGGNVPNHVQRLLMKYDGWTVVPLPKRRIQTHTGAWQRVQQAQQTP